MITDSNDKKKILETFDSLVQHNYIDFHTGGKYAYARIVIDAMFTTMNTYLITMEELYELIDEDFKLRTG